MYRHYLRNSRWSPEKSLKIPSHGRSAWKVIWNLSTSIYKLSRKLCPRCPIRWNLSLLSRSPFPTRAWMKTSGSPCFSYIVQDFGLVFLFIRDPPLALLSFRLFRVLWRCPIRRRAHARDKYYPGRLPPTEKILIFAAISQRDSELSDSPGRVWHPESSVFQRMLKQALT